MNTVLIIGGGAAGLMAAAAAAAKGSEVTVFEKMHMPGKKMLITGKGRCNITNSCDLPELIANLPGNGRFLNSALRQFTNNDVVDFFNSNGLLTKVERGGRIFPVSDRAKDVVDTMVRVIRQKGAAILTDNKVLEILVKDHKVYGLKTVQGSFYGDKIILAAGGASYPGTGSDGSGVKLAAAAGHTITPLKPSLVPLESDHPYINELQGLSLRNVKVTLLANDKKLFEDFGEMLFTHYGVSGPVILSMSNTAAAALAKGYELDLVIDLKPALSEEKLDIRIQRDFAQYSRKQLANGLKDLLPQSMILPVCDMAFVDDSKFINQISREERKRLLHTLKHFTIPITGTRPLAEAIVTAGGVSVKEINPKTMESKLIRGLYFAGEVMDIDGYTGGFNLQAAFSSGYAAGCAASE